MLTKKVILSTLLFSGCALYCGLEKQEYSALSHVTVVEDAADSDAQKSGCTAACKCNPCTCNPCRCGLDDK